METTAIFLEGRKTLLRPLEKTDIPKLKKWINDPEVRVFLANVFPLNEKSEEEFLEDLYTNARRADVVLGIVAKDSGAFIGTMGLHHIDYVSRTATTGAMIGEKEYLSKGYGTDAKMVLLHYAFNTLNLRKITSSVFAFNERSLNYVLHCGYEPEGTLVRQRFARGRYWDEILLGLFKRDFMPVWRHYKKTGTVPRK